MFERFHFTPVSTWPTIAREGIVPYPLTKEHLSAFRGVGLDATEGIYVWPEVDDALLQDFLMFKNMKTSVRSGLLLRCEIPAEDILGHQGFNPESPFTYASFTHYLSCTVNKDFNHKHSVPMDICLAMIPPRRITAVKKIEIAVSSVTANLDVLIV